MADMSLNEMLEQNRQRSENYIEKAKEAILKENPTLEWDRSKARVVNFSDVEYQVSSLEYYHVDYIYGASLRKTDLGYSVELKQDINIEHDLIEHGSRIFLVEKPYIDGDYVSDDTMVTEYWKGSGKRIGGKKAWRKVYKSTKGLYFEAKGVRIYMKWTVGQGA